MAGFTRSIGAAFVRLFTKKDELSAGLKQAEAEVKASAGKMQADASAVAGSFNAAGDAAKNAAGGAAAFARTLGTAVVVATRIGLIIAGIIAATKVMIDGARAYHDWWNKGEKSARKFGETIEEQAKSIDAIRDRFDNPTSGQFANELYEAQKILRNITEEMAKAEGSGLQSLAMRQKEAIANVNALKELNRRAEDRKSKADALRSAEETAKAVEAQNRQYEEERLAAWEETEKEKARRREEAEAESANRQKEVADDVLAFYHKMVRETHETWSKSIQERKQAEIAAAQEVADARLAAERAAFARIEAMRSLASGQSASGDIRTLTALVKQLVDAQR